MLISMITKRIYMHKSQITHSLKFFFIYLNSLKLLSQFQRILFIRTDSDSLSHQAFPVPFIFDQINRGCNESVVDNNYRCQIIQFKFEQQNRERQFSCSSYHNPQLAQEVSLSQLKSNQAPSSIGSQISPTERNQQQFTSVDNGIANLTRSIKYSQRINIIRNSEETQNNQRKSKAQDKSELRIIHYIKSVVNKQNEKIVKLESIQLNYHIFNLAPPHQIQRQHASSQFSDYAHYKWDHFRRRPVSSLSSAISQHRRIFLEGASSSVGIPTNNDVRSIHSE